MRTRRSAEVILIEEPFDKTTVKLLPLSAISIDSRAAVDPATLRLIPPTVRTVSVVRETSLDAADAIDGDTMTASATTPMSIFFMTVSN